MHATPEQQRGRALTQHIARTLAAGVVFMVDDSPPERDPPTAIS